jgi:hypothetical protein
MRNTSAMLHLMIIFLVNNKFLNQKFCFVFLIILLKFAERIVEGNMLYICCDMFKGHKFSIFIRNDVDFKAQYWKLSLIVIEFETLHKHNNKKRKIIWKILQV